MLRLMMVIFYLLRIFDCPRSREAVQKDSEVRGWAPIYSIIIGNLIQAISCKVKSCFKCSVLEETTDNQQMYWVELKTTDQPNLSLIASQQATSTWKVINTELLKEVVLSNPQWYRQEVKTSFQNHLPRPNYWTISSTQQRVWLAITGTKHNLIWVRSGHKASQLLVTTTISSNLYLPKGPNQALWCNKTRTSKIKIKAQAKTHSALDSDEHFELTSMKKYFTSNVIRLNSFLSNNSLENIIMLQFIIR